MQTPSSQKIRTASSTLRPIFDESSSIPPPHSSRRRGSSELCPIFIDDDGDADEDDVDKDEAVAHDTGGSQRHAESSNHAATSAADDTVLCVNIREASCEIDIHTPLDTIVWPLFETESYNG